MATKPETQDEIFKLYTEYRREIPEIQASTRVKQRTIYNILKSKGVVFRGSAEKEKIYIKEDKIAELLKVKFLEIKKEFPDFDVEANIGKIFGSKGIGSDKVIKCFRDPVKLDKALVKKARALAYFILNSLEPEKLKNASLNVQMQALPIILEIAGGKYPLQPDQKDKVDPKQLKQNILIMIQNIQKSDPMLTQEVKDMLMGVKKATEEDRLPALKG